MRFWVSVYLKKLKPFGYLRLKGAKVAKFDNIVESNNMMFIIVILGKVKVLGRTGINKLIT